MEGAAYSLNHVEGCTHGCLYPCYAYLMKKRFGKFKDYKDWREPRVVENSLELLEKELGKLKGRIESVYMCFATDLFMYKQKEIIGLSLEIIKRLNKEGIKVVTISKGIYSSGLTDKKIFGADNEYGSTVVSLSEDFRKKYEPFSASVNDRIKSLKKLHDAGLKTWVIMEPYPTPNIIKQDISEILEKISFIDEVFFGRMNYSKLVTDYKGYKSFYNYNVLKVMDFCGKKGIKCHIKTGTLDKNQLNLDYLNYPPAFKKIADKLSA